LTQLAPEIAARVDIFASPLKMNEPLFMFGVFMLCHLIAEPPTAPALEEAAVHEKQKETPQPEVTDYSGRPLFGGLRALKKEAGE